MIEEKKYSNIVLGGTFDKLHDGHLLLLKTASSLGNTISIGLTSEKYLTKYPKKFGNKIYSFDKRKKELLKFLNKISLEINFYIFPINHPWKNFSVSNSKLNAIIASEETIPSVELINKEREKNGFNKLECILIPSVINIEGEYLSSTSIRQKN